MNYTVLSPWAEVDQSNLTRLSPRLDDLNGKTIGMFGDFMINATYMLGAMEKELKKRYPNASFTYMRYLKETTDISTDEEFDQEFQAWAANVDCMLSFYGSVPSSALFLGYNSAYMEKLGKPTVMLVTPRTLSAGLRGIKARGVPNLRTIAYELTVDKISGHTNPAIVENAMADSIADLTDEIVSALTSPLTAGEAQPEPSDQEYARSAYTGTAEEISKLFYSYGWTNGTPIGMPTREAVDEMMRGTDLPADYIVAKIPPMMGCATVEKIAVNAVMAGCLPTYLPVLIAAVRGAMDPKIYLEGWCCSQSTWGPVLTLSGPIVKDIGLNVADNALSPYYKANAAIARAFGYLMMNIGGLRPGIEDLSEAGHEFRMGFCMGDNTDENPWGPLHTDFGFDLKDSAVTMFWPQEHRTISGVSPADFLTGLCKLNPFGWEPGAALIFTPICAKMFADAGWTKQRILDYMVEYARRPASEVDLVWLVNNNHPPETVDLPVNPNHSTRIFWSRKHMFALVAGGKAGPMMTVFTGGGDHGGPSCAKIELPGGWESLVKQYSDTTPAYINY